MGVGFDEVIGAPLDGLERVRQLAGGSDLSAVLDHPPRQHCDGERHREAELDVVASVVVSSDQVHLLLEAVGEAGVVAPGDALIVGQTAGALRLEVEEALHERFTVVRRPRLRAKGGRERDE